MKGILWQINTDGYDYWADVSVGPIGIIIPGGFSNNTWYSIALSQNNQDVRAYKNGIFKVGATAVNINVASYSKNIASYQNANRQFRGNIGAVYVYNRALTDDEIMTNHTAVRSRFNLP